MGTQGESHEKTKGSISLAPVMSVFSVEGKITKPWPGSVSHASTSPHTTRVASDRRIPPLTIRATTMNTAREVGEEAAAQESERAA